MVLEFALAILVATGSPTASDAVNQGYKAISDARAAGNIPGMAGNFTPDALLIDARPAPAMRGDQLGAQLAPMFARLKADGVTIRTHYRVEQRVVSGDTVVDAGYANMKFERANVSTQAAGPRDMIRRFMVTWQRDSEGRWKIIGDASFPATQEQWDAAKPQPGLFYQ